MKKRYVPAIGGTLLLLGVGSGVYIQSMRHKQSLPTQVEKSRKNLSPLDLVKQYAHVIPPEKLDSHKPILFYIGQTHKDPRVGEYIKDGPASQIAIFHILSALYDADALGAVFDEGSAGQIELIGDSRKIFQKGYDGNPSDSELERLLKRKPLLNGAGLFMLNSQCDNIYGLNTPSTAASLKQSITGGHYIDLKKWLIAVDIATEEGRNLVVRYEKVDDYLEAIAAFLDQAQKISRESIQVSLETVQRNPRLAGKNLAVVAGLWHVGDVQRKVAKGQFPELGRNFNVVYVIPHVDWPMVPIIEKIDEHMDHLEQHTTLLTWLKKKMEADDLEEIAFSMEKR